jgi:hypothetical protein
MNLKTKPALIALIVALAVLVCVSALLFLPKEYYQFYAGTVNLWTYQEIGGKEDCFRSSGIVSDKRSHDWHHTSYGLFFHWHVTDVAVDDPRVFYRFIDIFVIAIYAFMALVAAAVSWVVTFMIVHRGRYGMVWRGVIGAVAGLVSSLVCITGLLCVLVLVLFITKVAGIGAFLVFVSYLIGAGVGLVGGWFGGMLSKRPEKRFEPAISGALIGGGLATVFTPMLVTLTIWVLAAS